MNPVLCAPRLAAALAIITLTMSAPVAIADEPSAVRPEIARRWLTDDVRVIWMGDSFAAPTASRVPVGMLRTWPIHSITAMAGGFHSGVLSRTDLASGPLVEASSQNDFQILTSMLGDPSGAHFGLPLWRLLECFGGDDLALGADGGLFQLIFDPALIADGMNHAAFVNNDVTKARFMYLDPPDPAVMAISIRLLDDATERLAFNPATQSRGHRTLGADPTFGAPHASIDFHINAPFADVELTRGRDDVFRLGVHVAPDFVSSQRVVSSGGAVLYQEDAKTSQRRPGLYWSALADTSWSFASFGRDLAAGEPGAPPSQKTFSREQLAHWMDMTTLDPSQPVCFVFYLASEEQDVKGFEERFEAMLDVAEGAANDAGVSDVSHVLVVPHLHSVGFMNFIVSRQIIAGQRDAAYNVASRRDNVGAISIFDATDQVYFNGAEAASQWLVANGYTEFTYGTTTVDLATTGGLSGNLLDVINLHPEGPHGAAFFAHMMLRAIQPEAALSDINRDGVVNGADLAALLASWGSPSPIDLDGDGDLDGADLAALLSQWTTP